MTFKDCKDCFANSDGLRNDSFFNLTLRCCVECGRIVDIASGSAIAGRLKTTQSTNDSQSEDLEPSAKVQMYVIQPEPSLESIMSPKLDVDAKMQCLYPNSASEAISSISKNLEAGGAIRIILFNPDVMEGSGASFLYAIRALEIGFETKPTPILVLGETTSNAMDRSIKECKNAKFVSIGPRSEPSVLAERYLKVIKKLGTA